MNICPHFAAEENAVESFAQGLVMGSGGSTRWSAEVPTVLMLLLACVRLEGAVEIHVECMRADIS